MNAHYTVSLWAITHLVFVVSEIHKDIKLNNLMQM